MLPSKLAKKSGKQYQDIASTVYLRWKYYKYQLVIKQTIIDLQAICNNRGSDGNLVAVIITAQLILNDK